MPILKTDRETKKVTLPSFEGSEVEMYTKMTAGELFDYSALPDAERLQYAICKMIKSWNMTNEKGEPLEISVANLRALPLADGLFLINESRMRNENEKLKKNA